MWVVDANGRHVLRDEGVLNSQNRVIIIAKLPNPYTRGGYHQSITL